MCSEIVLHDVRTWFVFSSTGRESNNRRYTFLKVLFLLSDIMQCNLSIRKICVWTEVGVVIDLHCSLYSTHDLSHPEPHWPHMTVEFKECVIGARNIIALGFTTGLRQSGTKLRTRRFPDFDFFLRSLFLTVILLMRRIGWAPNNARKWQMGFKSVFIELNTVSPCVSVSMTDHVSHPYKTTDDVTGQGYVFVLA